MAWPTSPTNGATTTVNGVLYVYNSTSGSWSPTASSATDFNVGNITATGNISSLNESPTGNLTVGGNLTVTGVTTFTTTVANITGNANIGGNLTVTGITTSDVLTAVLYYPVSDPLGDPSITTVTDLTSEFSISAANTINNTGGTATTNGRIEVRYRRRVSVIGTAEVSGVSGDVGSVYINIQVM